MMPAASKINISPFVEEKPAVVSEEPQIYANKIVSLESARTLWTHLLARWGDSAHAELILVWRCPGGKECIQGAAGVRPRRGRLDVGTGWASAWQCPRNGCSPILAVSFLACDGRDEEAWVDADMDGLWLFCRQCESS